MRGIPTWVLWVGGAAVVLLIIVPLITGQPLLNISGGGISLNYPTIRLASGSPVPAQSTAPVLV